MLLNLTDISDEPLQSQISRQIRAKILNNDLSAGDLLPSIRILAREHRVSVVTVQRGYEILEREGLIHSRRGKGFFVSDLNTRTKKRMASRTFIEKVRPVFRIAREEGMTITDIREAVQILLEDEE